ncbi:MAG TPA: type VI secretion protein IcmF/TssM N-terminal domain-containing protein [Pyrinomonadaceae bacterium]|jgi:type VI secretion system protein ImpL
MLSPNWIYILLILILLVVGLLLFLYLVLKKARQPLAPKQALVVQPAPGEVAAPSDNSPAGFAQHGSSPGLRASFRRALRLLKTHVTGRDYLYQMPWFLMIGEVESGKTTLLANTGLNQPLGQPSEQVDGLKQGINWCFFDRGVVLDVAGDYVLRADGQTANSKGWNTITRLLQKHRPERPLDGIILTIPCTDLMGPKGLSPERRRKLEQKAASLYKKLWQAQKMLGMSFPVYVLVTKCDQVVGFKSLCKEIPLHLQDEMFGWSSPYTLETSYKSEWVSEAFQSVYRYLFQTQVEVFAERDDVEDGDGLFLLPSEIQALREPLQVYLDQIFKESSFHNSFFFRGLYFCGDSSGDAPAPAILPGKIEESVDWLVQTPDVYQPSSQTQTGTGTRKIVFLKHLFERKIFLEDMLARPVYETLLSRNRTVVAAQIAALCIILIGGAGLLLTYRGLVQREKELNEFLTREAVDLSELSRRYDRDARSALRSDQLSQMESLAAAGETDEDGVTHSVDDTLHHGEEHLLEAMSKINGRSFISPFIPSSWFSRINERIEDSLIAGFKYVILESLRLDLEGRTKDLLSPVPVYVTSTSLGTSTGRAPSSSAPSGSDALYAHASRQQSPAPPPVVIDPLYERPALVRPNYELLKFITELSELMANRSRYSKIRTKGTGSLEDLHKLVNYLGHAPLPDNFDKENDLFERAVKTVEGRPLESEDMPKEGARKLADMIEGIYLGTFENELVNYDYLNEIAQTESILGRPEYTWLATYVIPDRRSAFYGMTTSTALRELRRSLEDLSKERFMKDPSAVMTRLQLMRKRLIWDKEPLRQAIALYQEYDAFINKSYQHSENLDLSVKQAALAQLKIKIANLIAQAQKFQPVQRVAGESVLKTSIIAEVKSFEDAQGLLAQLLDICNRLRIDVGLREAVVGQASYLIGAVDRDFNSQNFYAMRQPDFSWWNGSKPISNTAFDVGGADELAGYLSVQRKSIAFLGRELASPIFTFMKSQNVSPQQLQGASNVDWDELLTALDRYENKVPGNSVAALENFIRFEMDRINLDDCDEVLRQSGGQSGDFFLQRRSALRRLLYERCVQLSARRSTVNNRRALAGYIEIEDAFNQTLAGRFPFSDVRNSQTFFEADPDSILAFFEVFDKNKQSARDGLAKNPQLGAAQRDALRFLDRMDRVREFFAAFLEKKVVPVFDFDFQFRVNQNKELGANQIIDWNLEVGKRKFGYLVQEKQSSRWMFGEPVRLTLRWANDSPSVPDAAAASNRLKVRERTAVIEYNNRWSLLLMMMRHAGAPTDFDQGVDIEPYTLKFLIRTRPDAMPQPIERAQRDDLKAELARIFMRVSLISASQKEPLSVPVFPQAAPRIVPEETEDKRD